MQQVEQAEQEGQVAAVDSLLHHRLRPHQNMTERDYNLIRLEPSARIAFGDSTPKDIIK